ncbi:MAG TPA: hypothetical protein VFT56_01580 [Sphingomonas sp.]|nr:hypothetical protein [Sphingomonas sp.]
MAGDDPFEALRQRRRTSWRGVALVVAIAFLAGLAVMALVNAYYGHWLPWGAPAASSQAAATPAAQATAGPPPTLADYDTLAAREAALAGQLSALEARAATINNQAAAASGNATRAEGLLVAFAARRALDRGLGLGYIEGQLRERFGATQPRAVATVIQASRAPVTLEDLRLGLASIGPDLVAGGRDNWWGGLRNAFANLIVLRKDGAPSPRPSDRLSRARHLLEGGQVEAALAEVSRLPGAPKAQRWITAAHRYIAARHALDVIETAAIIGPAPRPGSAAPPQSTIAPQSAPPAPAPPKPSAAPKGHS